MTPPTPPGPPVDPGEVAAKDSGCRWTGLVHSRRWLHSPGRSGTSQLGRILQHPGRLDANTLDGRRRAGYDPASRNHQARRRRAWPYDHSIARRRLGAGVRLQRRAGRRAVAAQGPQALILDGRRGSNCERTWACLSHPAVRHRRGDEPRNCASELVVMAKGDALRSDLRSRLEPRSSDSAASHPAAAPPCSASRRDPSGQERCGDLGQARVSTASAMFKRNRTGLSRRRSTRRRRRRTFRSSRRLLPP